MGVMAGKGNDRCNGISFDLQSKIPAGMYILKSKSDVSVNIKKLINR